MPSMIKCVLQFDKMIKIKWNLQAVMIENKQMHKY